MQDLSRYQAIIFDMDGTLIDSMPTHMQAWKKACEKYQYPFDLEFMNSLGGVPTRKTVELLNDKYQLTHNPEEVAKFKRQAWEAMDCGVPEVIADTLAVFEQYRPTLKIGIGTGAERPHAEKMLAETGLLDRIDALVTASDVKQGKPHPETFLTVAQEMAVEPARCVVFEDTQIGQQAAKEAGMDCFLVINSRIQW